jgi:hypothetical protein
MNRLRLPAEELEISEELDLLVVGGGSAGVAAAVTGARAGLRTALVEEMPFLGGMSTGGCVGTFCGFYYRDRNERLEPLVGGLPLEIDGCLRKQGHAYGPIPFKESAVLPYVPWGLKLLLEELVRREPLLRVRLHAKQTHVVVEDGTIRGVAVQTRSGRIALQARVVVDATGDADLARACGVATRVGEAIQYPSMMFTMQNVDVPQAYANIAKLAELIEARFESDGLPRRGGNVIPTGRHGEVLVAMSRLSLNGRPIDGSSEEDLTYGEMEGRVQATRLAEFLRQHMPGFEEAFLADAAPRLGIRETRKIVGEYSLSESDVLGAKRFDDGIGRAAWPIERHVAGGETVWKFLDKGTWYTIPYRSLVPQGVDNLLVAGRCLSAEPDAFASARVIGPCMLEGQAVGAAARIIGESDVPARDIDVDRLRADLVALGVPVS